MLTRGTAAIGARVGSRTKSSKALQAVRGTHDALPDTATSLPRRNAVIRTAAAAAERYGFKAVDTPLLEHAGVFARTLGETSDVVVAVAPGEIDE